MVNIPTTNFVPPYPTVPEVEQEEKWMRAVAGFCNGAQAVKNNDNIRSLRVGNLVFLGGKLKIERGISSISILPVEPRVDGFIQLCDMSGNLKGIMITANSKYISTTGITEGDYFISGFYITATKEMI